MFEILQLIKTVTVPYRGELTKFFSDKRPSVPYRGAITVPCRGGFPVPYNGDLLYNKNHSINCLKI